MTPDLLSVGCLPWGWEPYGWEDLTLFLSLCVCVHMCLCVAVRTNTWWSYGQELTELMLSVVSVEARALVAV